MDEHFPTLPSASANVSSKQEIRQSSATTWANRARRTHIEMPWEDVAETVIEAEEEKEKPVKKVNRTYVDRATLHSRVRSFGQIENVRRLKAKVLSQSRSDSAQYRSLILPYEVRENKGPTKLAILRKECTYKPLNERTSFDPRSDYGNRCGNGSNNDYRGGNGDTNSRSGAQRNSIPSQARRAVRCLDGNFATLADDMGRLELSTWEEDVDAEYERRRVEAKYGLDRIQTEINEKTARIAVPQTNITLSIGSGAHTDFNFTNNEVLVRGQVSNQFMRRMDGLIEWRSLECVSLGKTDTVLTFDSPDYDWRAIELLKDYGIEAERLPSCLVTGAWDGFCERKECILDLEWERKAVTSYLIDLPSLDEEKEQIIRVMREASEEFANTKLKFEYRKMRVRIARSSFSTDDDICFLRELLESNEIVVGEIKVCRDSVEQFIDTEERKKRCKRAINRRVLQIAIEKRRWNRDLPATEEDWNQVLDWGRLPWTIYLPEERGMSRMRVNSARVVFDSFENGEVIAAELQRTALNFISEGGFSLNQEDGKGVFARCKLREYYDVPLTVRDLTSDRLKEMNEKWRTESRFSHAEMRTELEPFNQWSCLISDDDSHAAPGFCRLIVEGFPASKVEQCGKELMGIINGDIMNCEGEQEWLLTGVGRNMANQKANVALEKFSVFVDFNVIGKEIRLFGENDECEKVKRRLLKLTKDRHTHIIFTRVTIGLPVYLNGTVKAIEACGGLAMLQKVVGECSITLCPDDVDKRTVTFEGTEAAHQRLIDFLGDFDDSIRASAKEEYEKARMTNPSLKDSSLSPLTSSPLCPLCFCRPDTDFYRLEACGHVHCHKCINHQISSELASRSFPIVCKSAGCGQLFAVSDLLHLLLGDSNSFRMEHLDEIKLRPLVKAVVAHALLTKRDRIFPCRLTADCKGIFERSRWSRIKKCRTCRKDACASCGFEPHSGQSCEEYEHIRENADASLRQFMRESGTDIRKCPNETCAAKIDKSAGCNHMECTLCKTRFCWICGFSSMDMGHVYKHMQDVHGGNGL